MVGRVELRWDGDLLGKALRERLAPALGKGMRAGLDRSGRLWDRAMQRRFNRVRVGPSLPGTIGRRTGSLARSLGHRVLAGPELEDNRLVLFSAGARYARAQQYGAVVKPRNAKRLAIPGPANQTAAGVTRQPDPKVWFAFAQLQKGEIAMLPSRRTPGNTVVLWRRTKRSRWQHWWTLARSVTLPGPRTDGSPSRLAFFETFQDQASDRAAILKSSTEREIRRAGIQAVVDNGRVRVL